MIFETDSTILMIIDVQHKLLNAVFNKESLEQKATVISKAINILDIPVIVTEQYPQGLGRTVENISSNLPNNTKTFEKTCFSALEELEVKQKLQSMKRKQVVIFGIETHICVYQTVAALRKQGFDVTVLRDCCGSRSETEYLAALDVMKSIGAEIKTTEMFLFEMLKSSKNSKFKEIQNLIK